MRSASNNQSYCQRSLEAAKVAILECLHANRDYKTLMIGFSKKELPEFFKRYQTFKNSVAKLINASKGQELYQFNLQFFPLTSTSPKSTQSVTNHHEDFADSHWCKLLIREMACLPGANDDPSWFAHHIIPDLPLEDVKKSVKALISKGFIAVDKKSGRLSQTKKDVIAEDPSYTNGTQFHRDVLDLALHTNLGEKKAHCDISATTFATDKETRVLLQKKYDQFLYGIFKSAGETSEPDYIYQVSLQLFPLMKSAT